jgi:hypothetical protein
MWTIVDGADVRKALLMMASKLGLFIAPRVRNMFSQETGAAVKGICPIRIRGLFCPLEENGKNGSSLMCFLYTTFLDQPCCLCDMV